MKYTTLPLLTLGAIGAAGTALAARPAPGQTQAQAQQTPGRPNIILIMDDQHRFDFMGYVNPAVITPNLDALAADGAAFTRAYSSTPSSTPARAALLTGQSPWHHGLIGYSGRIAEHYPNEMPQLLADAGYYTYGIGKMHWSPQRSLRGFAATELDESGRVEDPGFVSDYRRWFSEVAPGQNPDTTGIGWNAHGAATYALPEELHPTRWTGDRAVSVIENYDQENPLFLKVSFARPHSPYDPPQHFIDMYAGRENRLPHPATGTWDEAFSKNYSHNPADNPDAAFGDFGEEYAMRSRLHYAANITFVDQEIGRIIQALKDKGMYENSLIVFLSDHGDMLGDHYHWRKTYPYEGSAHIPFVVRWPASMQAGVARGTELGQLVEIRDVLPTLLDAVGAPVPAGIDGSSVLTVIRNPKAAWRELLDLEHTGSYSANSGWVALVSAPDLYSHTYYKYIRNYQTGREELYDLRWDPGERVNLSGAWDWREVLWWFQARMADHLAERGEPWIRSGKPQVIRGNVPVRTPNFPEQP